MKKILLVLSLLLISGVHAQTESLEDLLSEIEANLELATATASESNNPEELTTLLDEIQETQETIATDLNSIEHDNIKDTVDFLENSADDLDQVQIKINEALANGDTDINVDIPTAVDALNGFFKYRRDQARERKQDFRKKYAEKFIHHLREQGFSDDEIQSKKEAYKTLFHEQKAKRKIRHEKILQKIKSGEITREQAHQELREKRDHHKQEFIQKRFEHLQEIDPEKAQKFKERVNKHFERKETFKKIRGFFLEEKPEHQKEIKDLREQVKNGDISREEAREHFQEKRKEHHEKDEKNPRIFQKRIENIQERNPERAENIRERFQDRRHEKSFPTKPIRSHR